MLDLFDGRQSGRASPFPRANRLWRCLVASAALAGTLLSAAVAQALPLVTLAGNLRGLYGTELSDAELDPLRLGLGLSAGVTLPGSLYLGASFSYFLGESQGVSYRDATTRQAVARAEYSLQSYQLLGHIGYDLGLGPLTLRPSLGAGLEHGSQDFEGDDNPFVGDPGFIDPTWSRDAFLLSPGVEGFIGLGLWNVSAEVRYGIPLTTGLLDDSSLFFGLGVGLSL
jgi:hypothetical protein